MKNIDFGTILAYKKKIINAAIIILALLVGYNLYKSQMKGIDALKESKDTEHKKNNVLNVISENENKILNYKKFVNKKDIYSVMNLISNIAKEGNVKISSFKPNDEKTFPVYSQYLYNLKVIAPDYISLGKFIGLLESSNEVFIVESLSIYPIVSSDPDSGKGSAFEGVSSELIISTILFK